MKICPNCHAQLDDSSIFCTSCGTQFGAVPPQQNAISPQQNAVPPHVSRGALDVELQLMLLHTGPLPFYSLSSMAETSRFSP